MNKFACYCMTRNIYHKAIPAMKSLLIHSDVGRVYVLAEDDNLGFTVPDRVQVVNVSGQRYFTPDGPNYRNSWTWMVLMRVVLCHVLPDIDRVLSLDIDTIVHGDISGIWDIDLGDNYMAASPEVWGRSEWPMYVNGGVVLWNLARMRDGKADEIIHALNTRKFPFNEQDAMNELCAGHILPLDSKYNANNYTEPTKDIRILHYAARNNWYENEPLVKKYKDAEWK